MVNSSSCTSSQRVRRSELGEVVTLDVDSNQIESPFNDLENLPQDIVSFWLIYLHMCM